MRPIPHAAGWYLAVLELVFALGWTVYAIYLPQLAAAAGIGAGTVVVILMLDQAIFTVTDFAMGVAADKLSPIVGRLGHWVAGITLLSCLAFVLLPYAARSDVGIPLFIGLIVVWAATSSALRAPPLTLLGKHTARPVLPSLLSFAMLGLGAAGAVSPYLAMALAKRDPRLPFIIASGALVLTTLALAEVERGLAKQARPKPEPPPPAGRAAPLPIALFALAAVIFAFGFQIHFFFNSAPLFQHFSSDVSKLMPLFWVGFSIAMFPASRLTKRLGGLSVMGVAGMVGAVAIAAMEIADTLGLAVAAQLVAGAAWGVILMSAFAAGATLGHTGAEGKTTGLLFSALALATFTRMALTAGGAAADPALGPLLHGAPIACWTAGGLTLLALSLLSGHPAGRTSMSRK